MMESSQTIVRSAIPYGPMQVDWEPRVNFERLRRERLERTRSAIRDAGVDYLLLLRLENARYATGVKRLHWPTLHVGGGPVVLLEPAGDPTVWIIDPEFAHRSIPAIPREHFRTPHAIDLREDAERFVGELRECASRELDGSRIAADLWPPALLAAMQRAFPRAELVDGQEVMLGAREIKTRDEIDCMMMAYAMSEAAMQAAADELKPGIRECELVGTALRRMADFGSETAQCSVVVNSGPGSYPYRRFHTDRIIQHGEFVNMDFGACFNGYFGDFCRPFVCGGSPSPEQRDIFNRALDMQMAALSMLGPGRTPAELCAKLGRTTIGHGLGISAFEPPHLRSVDTFELRPGMTFSMISTPVGREGIGGVHIEDEVVITESGISLYSTYPRVLGQ